MTANCRAGKLGLGIGRDRARANFRVRGKFSDRESGMPEGSEVTLSSPRDMSGIAQNRWRVLLLITKKLEARRRCNLWNLFDESLTSH